jgi:hypothetical protein
MKDKGYSKTLISLTQSHRPWYIPRVQFTGEPKKPIRNQLLFAEHTVFLIRKLNATLLT